MRALLLVNHKARWGTAQAAAARQLLAVAGVDVVHTAAVALAAWPALIAEHAAVVDCVVVGGGDGSLNFAVGPIMQAGLTLGVLPLGTANDFARTLGISRELEAACETVAHGVNHRVDVGRVNDAYFLNAASIGLAVRARHYRSDWVKRRLGVLGYAWNIHAAIRDTRPFRVRVVCDGEHHTLHTIQLAIGNGRYFGGGLAVSSDSMIDDGHLDLFSLAPQSLGSLLRLLPVLLRGPDPSIRGGQLMQGTRIHVSTRRRRRINADGEILARTPAVFTVLPGALRVRVPPAFPQA